MYLRVGVGEIVDVPVRFEVENVNRTRVPCSSDGKRYTVRGHLQGPRSALERGAVTLYLHGVEISDAYFRYRGRVPGYDFMTEMAEVGHVSVSIDRLGHGESDTPEGSGICVGSQADMTHQVIDQLRAGGDGRPAFKRVALAGHSFGAYTAEIAAMSFKNADVLVGMAFAAEGINGPLIAENTVKGEQGTCNQGGLEKRPGGPLGYAALWQNTDRWAADTYDNVDPTVLADARAFRERSPCGELNSAVPTGVVEPLGYNDIKVPVLLLFGKQDDVFPSPAGERHRLLFTGSPEVTFHEIDPAGHTLMLQRSAPEFRARLSAWLKRQGF
jgi:pimeloyl-ACP methyl ester carboxylesterase